MDGYMYQNHVRLQKNEHTQGLWEGTRINLAKKIDEAAISDGA